MIKGKAVTVDVCFHCYWREKFEAEVIGNMGDGKLRKVKEGIFTQSDFYELLRSAIKGRNGKFIKRDLF